jgi:hypothetical protein
MEWVQSACSNPNLIRRRIMKTTHLLGATLVLMGQLSIASAAPRATSAAENAAILKLKENARDPSSVQVGGMKVNKTEKEQSLTWCGEANAKNAYGGYGGFRPVMGLLFPKGKAFTAMAVAGLEIPVSDLNVVTQMCKEHGL